jgi:hypothetical protein
MKRMRLLGWTFGMMLFSMASLALPLPASAGGVQVSIGLGVPVYPICAKISMSSPWVTCCYAAIGSPSCWLALQR